MASDWVVVTGGSSPDDMELLWEHIEVMLVALEKALLSLTDQIPKDQQKSAGKVGWLLLTSLKLQHHEILAWEAKIHEFQQVKEALEVWVHVLEQEVTSLEQGGLGELELEDGSEDSFNAGVVALPFRCNQF